MRFLSSFHLDCFYFTNNDGCINNTCLATYYINAQDFSSVNKKSHFIIFLIFNFICQEFILFASVKYLYFLYWNKYIHAPEYYLLWIYWCNRKVIFHSETIEKYILRYSNFKILGIKYHVLNKFGSFMKL